MKLRRSSLVLSSVLVFATAVSPAQSSITPQPAAKVIIDTDIGDDIDDAFAVDLALTSPELHLLGISAAWGDTSLRARMLDRMTCEVGREDIPIQTGPSTKASTAFSQAPWASQGIERPHGEA